VAGLFGLKSRIDRYVGEMAGEDVAHGD
jgi:hypothetical protein